MSSTDLLALLHHYEGCRLTSYPDPATGGEPITIGYGITYPGLKLGTTITQAQADQQLQDRLDSEFIPGVLDLATDRPDDKHLSALVSFAFNLGLKSLRRSTLLALHNAGNYTAAANEFGKWTMANGRPMKGLQRRRAAERAVYMGTDAATAIAAAERAFP